MKPSFVMTQVEGQLIYPWELCQPMVFFHVVPLYNRKSVPIDTYFNFWVNFLISLPFASRLSPKTHLLVPKNIFYKQGMNTRCSPSTDVSYSRTSLNYLRNGQLKANNSCQRSSSSLGNQISEESYPSTLTRVTCSYLTGTLAQLLSSYFAISSKALTFPYFSSSISSSILSNFSLICTALCSNSNICLLCQVWARYQPIASSTHSISNFQLISIIIFFLPFHSRQQYCYFVALQTPQMMFQGLMVRLMLQLRPVSSMYKNLQFFYMKQSADQTMEFMVGRASHHYGLEVDQWKVMGGYGGDWNVKLQVGGCAWTMKVSGSYRTEERLVQENDILQYLDDRHEGVSYPVPMQTVKGEKVVFEEFEGQVYGLRVLKFIEGVELSKYKGQKTEGWLGRLGKAVGEMQKLLQAYPREVYSEYMVIPFGDTQKMRFYADGNADFLAQIEEFEKVVSPILAVKPKTVVHGDLHADNILVNEDGEVVGILDVGCTGMSYTGFDIGTLLSKLAVQGYALSQLPIVFEGFSSVCPLPADEKPLLYYFMSGKLLFLHKYWRKNCGKIIDTILLQYQKVGIDKLFSTNS